MSPSLVVFLSHISIVIWAFLLFLGVLFLASVFAMLYSQVRLRRRLNSFANRLAQLADEEPKDTTRGLSLVKLDAMRVSVESLEGLPKVWWMRVNRSISLYMNQDEEDGWFITEPAAELLPYELVVRQNFHTAQFSAIPGNIDRSRTDRDIHCDPPSPLRRSLRRTEHGQACYGYGGLDKRPVWKVP